MEASEDNSETDEVGIRFEESVLSESGFEELACKYNVYIHIIFLKQNGRLGQFMFVYTFTFCWEKLKNTD